MTRTLLFLLPAVVPEVRDVVVLYAVLHLLQTQALELLRETLVHVKRHAQILRHAFVCVTRRPAEHGHVNVTMGCFREEMKTVKYTEKEKMDELWSYFEFKFNISI